MNKTQGGGSKNFSYISQKSIPFTSVGRLPLNGRFGHPSPRLNRIDKDTHTNKLQLLFQKLNDRYDELERGSEWEPIKILLEGDRSSNKLNTASNTRL
jgi:hypothetical protein